MKKKAVLLFFFFLFGVSFFIFFAQKIYCNIRKQAFKKKAGLQKFVWFLFSETLQMLKCRLDGFSIFNDLKYLLAK